MFISFPYFYDYPLGNEQMKGPLMKYHDGNRFLGIQHILNDIRGRQGRVPTQMDNKDRRNSLQGALVLPSKEAL